MSALVVFHHGSIPKVLLLEHAGDGVLVLEDEVHFVGRAALVGAEHDGVGAASVERLLARPRHDDVERLALRNRRVELPHAPDPGQRDRVCPVEHDDGPAPIPIR